MTKINKRHLYDAFISMKKTVGLYIHIPYCKQKCYYCDFLSSCNYRNVDEYMNALYKEIILYKEKFGSQNIDTIYIGGGTPSSIKSVYIQKLMDIISENNRILSSNEITIEVNPESVTYEKLKSYYSSGINRISMGCQSFDDEKLKSIGRIHNSNQIYKAYESINDSGFKNINLDLIFALPKQSFNDFEKDVDKLLSLESQHISAYSLILEEETPLYDMTKKGDIKLVSDETDRNYYHYLIDTLDKYGYKQYEISNFAKSGYESKHNLKYWDLDYYIGLGLGSSSFFNSQRYSNESSFDNYINSIDKGNLPWINIEEINYDNLKIDYVLMRLRLKLGIDRYEYKTIFGIDIYEEYKELIDSFIENKNMVLDDDRLAFTSQGFDISNQFFLEII